MHLLLALVSSLPAEAHSSGQTGRSIVGCSCHGVAADATTVVAFGGAPTSVLPGEVVPITVTVSSSNGARVAGGLDVSATGGTLTPGAKVKLSNGEITHTQPAGMSGGSVTFDFTWTAPSTNGTFTFHGAGNAVNLNGTSAGDGWNLADDLVIDVDNGCDDVDGDGFDTCNGDCDDTDADVSPIEAEVCDGIDNDCSGDVDDDASDAGLWYPDADLDGFGDDNSSIRACTQPFNALSTRGDCNDGNAGINPNAIEVCDAGDVDQDCDGLADDASAVDVIQWFTDADSDGFGVGAPVLACDPPQGRTALDGDCNDSDPAFNPGATEDCSDPVDLNCDGATGFVDNDNDGYPACQECDDGDSSNFPGAFEVCDGEDDDCDGTTDEDDAIDAATWYRDNDGDGHGASNRTSVACAAPTGFVALSDDCDDTDAAVSPDAAEVWYDGFDQNCDGNDDDQDADGVAFDTDCVDVDPEVYPGAADLPYDGVDSDCAGNDDFDQDADGHPAAPPDGDGDDCNDTDGAIFPGATDPTCDDVDLDCDPAPDTDPSCASDTNDTGVQIDRDPPDEEKGPTNDGCGCATSGWSGWIGFLLVLVPVMRRARIR